MLSRRIVLFALVLLFLLFVAVQAGPTVLAAVQQSDDPAPAPLPAMTKRAEIRVIPMLAYAQGQAELAEMREVVRELRAYREGVRPTVTLQRQWELEDRLAALAERHVARYTSDDNKSETALLVQSRLNQMEGNYMCGACHGPGMRRGMGPMHRGGPR